MMTSFDTTLTLGYDLDKWHGCGAKFPVTVDISPENNSHILICGMSGSGKSYAEQSSMAKLALASSECEMFFADYKGEAASRLFETLRVGTPR